MLKILSRSAATMLALAAINVAAINLAATSQAAEITEIYSVTTKVSVVTASGRQDHSTKAAAPVGEPIEVILGTNGDFAARLNIREIAGTSPQQYQSNIDITRDGKQIASPSIVTVRGSKGIVEIGQAGADNIRFEVIVNR